MSDLAGTHGVIVGVANKRSIAWAIAQALTAAGARLALTYQDERLRENVEELAAACPDALVLPCDVGSDEQVSALFESVGETLGGLDFLVHGAAFAPRSELTAPFVETSREGFRVALDISAYSLIALARGAAPLMERRGGGSILTLTYLGSQRVFPNYNVMGVAKAALESVVRYLAYDLGTRNIRVNAVSAGPIKTLAAAGISGFSDILQVYRDRAPLRRNVDAAEVADAAVFLLGPAGRAITGEILMVDAGFHAVGLSINRRYSGCNSSRGRSVQMRYRRPTLALLLAVMLVPPLVSACGKSVGETIDDATITTRVKTALLNDPEVGALRIDVDTALGVVTLSGVAKTRAEEQKAIAVARRITGVKDVKSTLNINPGEA